MLKYCNLNCENEICTINTQNKNINTQSVLLLLHPHPHLSYLVFF